MTKQELIILAELNYYLTEDDSEQVFNLMEEESKKLAIQDKIDSGYSMCKYEFKFFLDYFNRSHLEEYFCALISNGEDISENNFQLLTEEQAFLYFSIIKESLFDEGPDGISDWINIYEKKFNKYKANLRDKKINSILND